MDRMKNLQQEYDIYINISKYMDTVDEGRTVESSGKCVRK
jgi:hypothetical protein